MILAVEERSNRRVTEELEGCEGIQKRLNFGALTLVQLLFDSAESETQTRGTPNPHK
jgi:hypothetical protein